MRSHRAELLTLKKQKKTKKNILKIDVHSASDSLLMPTTKVSFKMTNPALRQQVINIYKGTLQLCLKISIFSDHSFVKTFAKV